MDDLKHGIDFIEELCNDWLKALIELIRRLKSEGKKVVLVAMSRKMPRLFEVIKKEFSDDESNTLKDCLFITEHVLPYFLHNFNSEEQCLVIMDDAIYYGSTINQITGYIEKITSIRPFVMPVAINEVFGDLRYAKLIWMEDHQNAIKEKHIPFFTTQLTELILELRRPLDMEFPILRFDFSEKDTHKNLHIAFKERSREAFEKYFQKDDDNNDIYVIHHDINIRSNQEGATNYNVLPKKGSPYDQWNNDFCKMRFFVSDTSIQVVAFAPGILSEDTLTDEVPLFSDNRIQRMWDAVRVRKMAEWRKDETETEDFITKSIRDSYERQCARSRVIWANYLASFIYLLKHKKAICNTISDILEVKVEEVMNWPKFSKEDTQQMLPPELSQSMTDSLNRCFQEWGDEDCAFNSIHSAVLANQELIPDEYKNEYIEITRNSMQRCSTAEEALSVLFSNQQLITNGGKMDNDALRRSLRLRFGVTYNALETKLAFPVGFNGLWRNIHKWIDKNIDEGAVKPRYERIIRDGKAYWIRTFRAGENENSFTKMRRLCEFVIQRLRQKEHRGYVERSSVEDILTLVWEDPCSIINYTYKWDAFYKKKSESSFYLTYKTDDGMFHNFVDFLIMQDYLQTLMDSSGVERISTIQDDSQIVTSLSALQEQAIIDYIEAYYFYSRYQLNITKSLFPKKGLGDDTNKLIAWRDNFDDYMKKFIISNTPKDTRRDDFDNLDQSLSDILQETIRAGELPIADNSVTGNRAIIQQRIKDTEKDEEYIQFKNKALVAIVVKELFKYSILGDKPKTDIEITKLAEAYLDFINENDKVILNFLYLNETDRQTKEKQEEVIHSLQNILLRRIA